MRKTIIAAAIAALTLTACGGTEGPTDYEKSLWQQQWDEQSDGEKAGTCRIVGDGSLLDALMDDPETADIAGEYTGFMMTRCIGGGYSL